MENVGVFKETVFIFIILLITEDSVMLLN